MERVEIELLTPVENNAVVRLPGRRFPGVVIQGDSLSILVERVRSLRRGLDATGELELQSRALEVEEMLSELQVKYENTLAAHGLELPYQSR